MIVKFSLYESISVYPFLDGKPKVGDYVICREVTDVSNIEVIKLNDFLSKNIGYIFNIKDDEEYPYVVRFDKSKIPVDISYLFEWAHNDDCRVFGIVELEYFSNSKEELEGVIIAKKYNL